MVLNLGECSIPLWRKAEGCCRARPFATEDGFSCGFRFAKEKLLYYYAGLCLQGAPPCGELASLFSRSGGADGRGGAERSQVVGAWSGALETRQL